MLSRDHSITIKNLSKSMDSKKFDKSPFSSTLKL